MATRSRAFTRGRTNASRSRTFCLQLLGVVLAESRMTTFAAAVGGGTGGLILFDDQCAFDPPAPNDEMPAIRGSVRPSITGGSHALND